MATPQWPDELPRLFLVDGYSERSIDERLWPNRESGGAPRLSGTSNLKEISGGLTMLSWQRARLERFFTEETSRGVKRFIFADPIRHGAAALTDSGVPWLTADGTPILLSCWRLARFTSGGIVWSVRGVRHLASFTLLIYDK